MKLEIPRGDIEALRRAEARISARTQYRLTLHKLINTWTNLVASTERGDVNNLYDFSNDATSRDLIDEILADLSTAASSSVKDDLASWDERYLRATKPLSHGSGLWSDREPLAMTEE